MTFSEPTYVDVQTPIYAPIYSITEDAHLPTRIEIFESTSKGVMLSGVYPDGTVIFRPAPTPPAIDLHELLMHIVDQDLHHVIPVTRIEKARQYFSALHDYIHLAPFIQAKYPDDHRTTAAELVRPLFLALLLGLLRPIVASCVTKEAKAPQTLGRFLVACALASRSATTF